MNPLVDGPFGLDGPAAALAALLLVVAVAVGIVAGLALAARSARPSAIAPTARPEAGEALSVVPAGVSSVLGVLRSSALIVDSEDRVIQASAPAYVLGLVRNGTLLVPQVADAIAAVRRDGEIRHVELELPRAAGPSVFIDARVAALNAQLTLVLAEDRTREKRVEAIRRDFVANVSHELKTPVGALMVLAEAVYDAADDTEAVQRFATRMQSEATRLGDLVQQIIALSRLQGDDASDACAVVAVDTLVHQALDVLRTEADARQISLVFDGQHGLEILGNFGQLSLALNNLVSNAVAYSKPGGQVTVSALRHELNIDLTVSDDGIGIPREDLDRIFERFYRVDPARHRVTGGNGLGLSIVKHVSAAHGGEVKVWSQVGLGSTFTLRLPRPLDANKSVLEGAPSS